MDDLAKDRRHGWKVSEPGQHWSRGSSAGHSPACKGWPERRDAGGTGPVGVARSIKGHPLLMKNVSGKSRLVIIGVCVPPFLNNST